MAKTKTKSKTWKIGEYAKGGVLTVEITGEEVHIIGKDWDFSTGSKKSSDQSNAQEFTRTTLVRPDRANYWGEGFYYRAIEALNDLTTSFYAEDIYKWISLQINGR